MTVHGAYRIHHIWGTENEWLRRGMESTPFFGNRSPIMNVKVAIERKKKVSGKNGSEIVGRISERIRRWRVNRKSQLECRKSEIGKFGCILGPDGPTIGRCIGERQDGTLGPASRPIKSWSVQLGSKTRSRLVHEEARSPRRTRVTETTPRKAKPGREKKF